MATSSTTAKIFNIPTRFNMSWNDFKLDDTGDTSDQTHHLYWTQTRLSQRIDYLQMRVAYLEQQINLGAIPARV